MCLAAFESLLLQNASTIINLVYCHHGSNLYVFVLLIQFVLHDSHRWGALDPIDLVGDLRPVQVVVILVGSLGLGAIREGSCHFLACTDIPWSLGLHADELLGRLGAETWHVVGHFGVACWVASIVNCFVMPLIINPPLSRYAHPLLSIHPRQVLHLPSRRRHLSNLSSTRFKETHWLILLFELRLQLIELQTLIIVICITSGHRLRLPKSTIEHESIGDQCWVIVRNCRRRIVVLLKLRSICLLGCSWSVLLQVLFALLSFKISLVVVLEGAAHSVDDMHVLVLAFLAIEDEASSLGAHADVVPLTGHGRCRLIYLDYILQLVAILNSRRLAAFMRVVHQVSEASLTERLDWILR